MPDSPKPSALIFFTPEFKRNVRALARKYPHIRSDVQPFIDQIQRGELIGDKVQRTGYTIFKVRIRNSDVSRVTRQERRVSSNLLSENPNGSYSGHDLFQD